jgi:hypothetical protein
MQNYDCTSEDAQKLLDNALTDDWVTDRIFESIDECACGMFAPKYEVNDGE